MWYRCKLWGPCIVRGADEAFLDSPRSPERVKFLQRLTVNSSILATKPTNWVLFTQLYCWATEAMSNKHLAQGRYDDNKFDSIRNLRSLLKVPMERTVLPSLLSFVLLKFTETSRISNLPKVATRKRTYDSIVDCATFD